MIWDGFWIEYSLAVPDVMSCTDSRSWCCILPATDHVMRISVAVCSILIGHINWKRWKAIIVKLTVIWPFLSVPFGVNKKAPAHKNPNEVSSLVLLRLHSASYRSTYKIYYITKRKLLHDRPAESNKEGRSTRVYISTFSTVLHFPWQQKTKREKSLGGSLRILFSLILLNVTLLSIMRTIGMSPSMFVQRSCAETLWQWNIAQEFV